jgi:hypothetical protein
MMRARRRSAGEAGDGPGPVSPTRRPCPPRRPGAAMNVPRALRREGAGRRSAIRAPGTASALLYRLLLAGCGATPHLMKIASAPGRHRAPRPREIRAPRHPQDARLRALRAASSQGERRAVRRVVRARPPHRRAQSAPFFVRRFAGMQLDDPHAAQPRSDWDGDSLLSFGPKARPRPMRRRKTPPTRSGAPTSPTSSIPPA